MIGFGSKRKGVVGSMFSLLSCAFGRRLLCPGLCCPLLWNHFRFSIWVLVLSYASHSLFMSVIVKALLYAFVHCA